jgi:hypothetical protein
VCRSWFNPISIDNTAVKLIASNVNCTASFSTGEGDNKYDDVSIRLIYNQSMSLLSDYFTIACTDKFESNDSTTKKNFYPKLPYAAIRKDSTVLKRLNKQKATTIDDFNILMLGLDSISRLQFERMLPRTYHYITKTLDGIVLQGKLDDIPMNRIYRMHGQVVCFPFNLSVVNTID